MKSFLFFVTLWQLVCTLAQVPAYILPTPLAVGASLYEHFFLILHHTFISLSALSLGFALAVVTGILSAVWLYHMPNAARLMRPFLLVMQATPSFVLFPLLMMWIGHGAWAKILVISLSCYFPICLCFWDALNHPPQDLVDLGQTLRPQPLRLFWYIRLPAAMPGLLSGLQLAAIHAPLTTLASEWMGAQGGLGYLIMLTHGRLETDLMFATLVVVISMTFIFSTLIQKLQKKVLFWTW